MPENPHWYTLRKTWADDAAFVEAVEWMRAYGYPEIFEGRKYTMYNLNGHKYWTMGAPIWYKNGNPCTILINRKPLDYASDYDLIADQYDELFQDEASAEENREIFTMIPRQPRDRILDVGCGTGLFFDCVGTAAFGYVGIDPSRRMLDILKTRVPDMHAYAGISGVCNARLEEFHDEDGFDLIVALFGAASYIKPDHFERVLHMVRPGGRVFAMFYQDRYVPVTYERTGVAFPHWTASEYDLSKFRKTEYKNAFVIAEFSPTV